MYSGYAFAGAHPETAPEIPLKIISRRLSHLVDPSEAQMVDPVRSLGDPNPRKSAPAFGALLPGLEAVENDKLPESLAHLPAISGAVSGAQARFPATCEA